MFVTKNELAALLQLADRAPKSMAEQLWLDALAKRIGAEMDKPKEKDAEKPIV